MLSERAYTTWSHRSEVGRRSLVDARPTTGELQALLPLTCRRTAFRRYADDARAFTGPLSAAPELMPGAPGAARAARGIRVPEYPPEAPGAAGGVGDQEACTSDRLELACARA